MGFVWKEGVMTILSSVRHKVYLFVRRMPCCLVALEKIIQFKMWIDKRKALRLMRMYGLEACERIFQALSEKGICHWADHGTMLGIIRENGLISHDPDMDYSVPHNVDLADIYRVLSKRGFALLRGFAIQGEVVEITMSWEGVSVDFFKCHPIGARMGHFVFVSKLDETTWKVVDVMAHERVRPCVIGPIVRSFGPNNKTHAYIPQNADELLTASYGNWRIPDSKTDFCKRDIPTQYRDVHEGCSFLSAEELLRKFGC